MKRRDMIRAISSRLHTRDLIWMGTRGDDVQGLLDIPNLAASFSVINTFQGSASIQGTSLERHSRLRVDLDAHDIDENPRALAVTEMRAELLDALSLPSAVVAYRPSMFLSAVCFTRPKAVHLGMFKDHQSAFEHKPWVETEVERLGIPSVPWLHVSDGERGAVARMLDDGPVMLRVSRSSGGAGLTKVADPQELDSAWPAQDEAFVSVSRFIDGAVPLNIGGVVWHDGVTVHLPSVQLIGHPKLTTREFGYAGNDFARAKDLDDAVIRQIGRSTRRIGRWLRSRGFRGAFGVDFLLRDGEPLFVEVNPRLQGSTHLSSLLSIEAGESCIMTDHVAAHLRLDAPKERPLVERVRDAADASHLVHHWIGETTRSVDARDVLAEVRAVDGWDHADVLLPPGIACGPGSTIARHTFRRTITSDGFDLDGDVDDALRQPASAGAPTRQEAMDVRV